MKVSAQYAQENFPDILTAASGGEEVEIACPASQRSSCFSVALPLPLCAQHHATWVKVSGRWCPNAMSGKLSTGNCNFGKSWQVKPEILAFGTASAVPQIELPPRGFSR